MKKRWLNNGKVMGQTILRMAVASFMCLFLSLSLSVITQGILSQNIGYRIVEQKEDGTVVTVEEYYYEPGEEEKSAEDLDLAKGQKMDAIRQVPAGVQIGADAVTLAISVFILLVFPYNLLWQLGDKDSVGVRYKGEREDRLRGLKIGLLADIPYLLLYAGLIAAKCGWLSGGYLPMYRMLHLPFLPYINWIVPGSITSASQMSVGQILGLLPVLLAVPAVCTVAYMLGGRQISLKERMTYTSVQKGNPDTEI